MATDDHLPSHEPQPTIGHRLFPEHHDIARHSLRLPTVPRAQRAAIGRQLARDVPPGWLAEWDPAVRTREPLELIEESHQGRVDELIPTRVGRMASSPYGFLRGSAVVMAHDVAALPSSGVRPVLCGDAHLGNFGFYRSPEGELVIDLNDFDEAHPGAWEWDLRRLVAAIHVAGRENGRTEEQCAEAVRSCVTSYVEEIGRLALQPLLDRSLRRINLDVLNAHASDAELLATINRAARSARKRTSDRALPRFTTQTNGRRRLVDEPPLITHPDEREFNAVADGLDAYLATLAPHWRRVVSGYTLVDIAHKVVGVGSVGLRAWVALLQGSAPNDVLFLQLKQARRSVLAQYVHGAHAQHEHQGQRVVEYQQALQAVSDPLLGWTTIDGRDYYVRQFRNMKGTVPLDSLGASALVDYSGIVGGLLGMGHARTAGASIISGYLGTGHEVREAMVVFASRYADQTERDHADFVAAARAGRLPIHEDALQNMGSAFRPGG